LALACLVAAPAASAERVQFTATDGTQLIGHLYGTRGPGVVLAPMHPADQRSWSAFAETLAARGLRAFTFDFRGYGESGGTRDVAAAARDVEGAYRSLVGRKIRPVWLVGASMGGTAALMVAARVPVAGVATLSAPLAFQGLDASAALPAIRVPVLLVAARGDGEAAATATRVAGALAAPGQVHLVNGRAHGTQLLEGLTGPGVGSVLEAFLGVPQSGGAAGPRAGVGAVTPSPRGSP
jgi:pimeloyl-ACP methyl ester carboxylesterase